jgi:hypothetical protein
VEQKRCAKCAETNPLAEFNRDRTKKDGRRSRCKACRRDSTVQAQDRRRKTGVTKELFNALLIVQANRCGICAEPVDNSAPADHCHDTMAPRGILCRSCNLGMGLMKDNVGILRRAVAYLERPPSTPMLIEFANDMTEEMLRATAIRSGIIQIPQG